MKIPKLGRVLSGNNVVKVRTRIHPALGQMKRELTLSETNKPAPADTTVRSIGAAETRCQYGFCLSTERSGKVQHWYRIEGNTLTSADMSRSSQSAYPSPIVVQASPVQRCV